MLYRKGKSIFIFLIFFIFVTKFLFAQSFATKNFKEFYLSNKLRVIHIKEKENPLVRMRIVIFNGESSSFPSLEGLATLTARSFFKGSFLFPESQLSRLLSYYGVKTSCEVREERTSFSISLPRDNFERFLIILNDLLLRNTFPEDSLNEERNLIIRELRRRNNEPSFFTYSFLYRNILNRTPYTKVLFTEESLKRVTSQNCLTFLKRYFIPNNSTFFIWGDFEPDILKKTLERSLTGWMEKNLYYPYIPLPSPVRENSVSILNFPLQDSYFVMGNVLPSTNLEERAGLLLLNEVLGGSDFSRINLKFKETLGYCNFIESGVHFLKNSVLFFVAGQCKTDKIKEVITGVSAEIKDLKEKRIEEKELRSAKDYLLGYITVKNSDPENLLSSLEDAIYCGFPLDYMDRITRIIEGYSRENFLSIANKYFKIESNFIVVAGKKEILSDSLKDFGKVEIYFKINNSWEKER